MLTVPKTNHFSSYLVETFQELVDCMNYKSENSVSESTDGLLYLTIYATNRDRTYSVIWSMRCILEGAYESA